MDYLILYCALKLLEIAAPLLRIAIAALLSSFCAICLLQMHLSLLFVLILRLLLFVLTTAFVVPPKNAELYYRVIAMNMSGEETVSDIYSFKTAE